jgi:hypothetical protein
MSFHPEMLTFRERLEQAGIPSLAPDDDEHMFGSGTISAAMKRKASFAHIRRIKDPRTFGICVLNYDKYGVASYIGANSFAEIAVATTASKRVFLVNGIPDAYKDELLAWGVTPLFGRLQPVIDEFGFRCRQDARQLDLF